MSEPVKQLVNELVQAWNSHDLERVLTFYASDYEGADFGRAEPQRGLEGIRQTLLDYWRAFPDLRFSEDEILVEGGRVALLWTAQGTHRGSLLNIPPTGQRIEVRGIALLTVDRKRIIRGLYLWDLAGLLRAIGLLPDL